MDLLQHYIDILEPRIDPAAIAARMEELATIEMPSDWDSFKAAAAWFGAQMEQAGFTSDPLYFPADGEQLYQAWTAPIGFRTRRAICTLIETDGSEIVLANRKEEPNAAVVGTGYTGTEGVCAPVVCVTNLKELQIIDCKEKILYSPTLTARDLRCAAVAGKAAAVLSSSIPDRDKNRHLTQWANAWDSEPDGWLPTREAARQNLPGMVLSPAMGEVLEAALNADRGVVEVRIVTEGEYFEDLLPAAHGYSLGSEPWDVLLTGHLFEQGLIDNASGPCAALAASAAVLGAVADGALPPLKRGIRHFHSQESYGVLALREFRPEIPEGCCAHLNLDMIGQSALPLVVHPGLWASQSFSHLLLQRVTAAVFARLNLPMEFSDEFDINCTVLADPALGGVPTSSFAQDNPYWHTSGDRPGAVIPDATMLKGTALAAAVWTAMLTHGGAAEADWLLDEYESEITAALKAKFMLDGEIYLEQMERELSSILQLLPPDEQPAREERIDVLCALIRDQLDHLPTFVPAGTDEARERSQALYPFSTIGGPAVARCFENEPPQTIHAPKWNVPHLTLRSWADGTRSVYEIVRHTCAELNRPRATDLDKALQLFEIYARADLLALHDTPMDGRV